MKILVTGGAGLIGSHLTDILLEKNYKVDVIDNLSFGNIQNLQGAKNNPNFKFFKEDVVNLKNISDRYDVICHLASLKKVWGESTITSSQVMEVNYEMTRSVLEKCVKEDSKLLFTSTSDIYGNSNSFLEDSDITMGPPTHPRYSYALSKWHSEQLILNKSKEKNITASIARVFGCASKRSNMSWSGGHVPLFVSLASKNEDIVIHGDGKQTRSISHAKDIAMGLMNMVQKINNLNGEIINLGTDQQTTVEYVANYVIKKMNSNSKIVYQENFHKGYNEIKVRYANTQKAKSMLEFVINFSTEQVIDELIKD